MGLFKTLTPEERVAKELRKAQERKEREERRAKEQELEKERVATLPYFQVRQVREVLVQAEDMSDAIALGTIAFEEGQEDDYTLNWSDKPYDLVGDTRGPIGVVDIRAIKTDSPSKTDGPHSRACGFQQHDHGVFCSSDCPTCGGE